MSDTVWASLSQARRESPARGFTGSALGLLLGAAAKGIPTVDLERLEAKSTAGGALAPSAYLLVLAGLLCFGGAFATPAAAATITMLPISVGSSSRQR